MDGQETKDRLTSPVNRSGTPKEESKTGVMHTSQTTLGQGSKEKFYNTVDGPQKNRPVDINNDIIKPEER
jgi:hypothetical protein